MSNPKLTETYRTICQRLRSFKPAIDLDQHIDENHVDNNGQPTFKAEPSILGGVTFHAKNWELLRREFVNARNASGDKAFDYFSLKPSKLGHFFKSAFSLNLLDISYLATHGHGFREIWNPLQLDERPLSMADARPGRIGAGLWDKRFGARFGEAGIGDKRRDITSVHAAIMDDICNIHIDDVGFVMRLGGVGGMNPDFGQHLVDELVWKTYIAPLIWEHLGEHVTINLPSSRTGYAPSLGITVDLPDQGLSLSATFTFKCKCLNGGRMDIDSIPEGYSIGVGLTKTFDFGGGSGPKVKKR